MRRRSTAGLPAIVKTDMDRRFTRSGSTRYRECWGAKTADGVWSFVRFDEPGTPWGVYHEPSRVDGSYPLPVSLEGSLEGCRWAVASGAAERNLEQRKIEEAARAARRRS